jgi:hypothetical protein
MQSGCQHSPPAGSPRLQVTQPLLRALTLSCSLIPTFLPYRDSSSAVNMCGKSL